WRASFRTNLRSLTDLIPVSSSKSHMHVFEIIFRPPMPNSMVRGAGSKRMPVPQRPLNWLARQEGVEFMSPIKTFGLALVAALSLGASAAMAQEGANDTISGATWPPPVVPGALLRGQATQPGMFQSGSSDV